MIIHHFNWRVIVVKHGLYVCIPTCMFVIIDQFYLHDLLMLIRFGVTATRCKRQIRLYVRVIPLFVRYFLYFFFIMIVTDLVPIISNIITKKKLRYIVKVFELMIVSIKRFAYCWHSILSQ